MARYSDTRSLGRSSEVPYIPGEEAGDRHLRRMLAANEARRETIVRKWCAENAIAIDIKNFGHHWILTKEYQRAEWWPSSAKLIFNKQWDKGVHCHDISQLKREVLRRFGV
jgi:hypothetical protein